MPALKSIVTKSKSFHRTGRVFCYCVSNGPLKTQMLKTFWDLSEINANDLDKLFPDTNLSLAIRVFKAHFHCLHQILSWGVYNVSDATLCHNIYWQAAVRYCYKEFSLSCGRGPLDFYFYVSFYPSGACHTPFLLGRKDSVLLRLIN